MNYIQVRPPKKAAAAKHTMPPKCPKGNIWKILVHYLCSLLFMYLWIIHFFRFEFLDSYWNLLSISLGVFSLENRAKVAMTCTSITNS